MMKLTVLIAAAVFAACALVAPGLPAVGDVGMEASPELLDLMGIVQEITDEAILLTTPDGMDVQANLFPDTAYEGQVPAVGDWIHITYNGAMTRSLPPQIAALRVSCWQLSGTVEELNANGFLLRPSDGSMEVQVNADDSMLSGIAQGMTVTVWFSGVMTMSLPGQIGAELIALMP